MLLRKLADSEGFLGILVPLCEVADSQEVFVIGEEFFEACSRDVGELDLHFGRSGGCFRAFDDVLLAGPRRLNHLVDGAVALPEESLAEVIGEIVDNLGLLEGVEVSVAVVPEEARLI